MEQTARKLWLFVWKFRPSVYFAEFTLLSYGKGKLRMHSFQKFYIRVQKNHETEGYAKYR